MMGLGRTANVRGACETPRTHRMRPKPDTTIDS
jgi:hypothetical protein